MKEEGHEEKEVEDHNKEQREQGEEKGNL